MSEQILIRFGNRVREERHRQGLSQEQLAEKAGLHRTYIGMVERAEKNITLGNVDRICRALAVDLSKMFEDLHEPELDR